MACLEAILQAVLGSSLRSTDNAVISPWPAPATAARRLIIASTTRRVNGRPVSLSSARSTLFGSTGPVGTLRAWVDGGAPGG